MYGGAVTHELYDAPLDGCKSRIVFREQSFQVLLTMTHFAQLRLKLVGTVSLYINAIWLLSEKSFVKRFALHDQPLPLQRYPT